MRRRHFLAGITVLALPTRAFASPQRSKFVFSGGRAQLSRLDAAIESAIADMPGVLRPFARRRLRASHRPGGPIELVRSPGRIQIRMSGKPTIEGRPESAFGWTGVTGERYRVTIAPRPSSDLDIRFKGDHGTTLLSMRGSGPLTVSLVADDDRLGDTLRFALSYKRVD
jgi:hypothetical protein